MSILLIIGIAYLVLSVLLLILEEWLEIIYDSDSPIFEALYYLSTVEIESDGYEFRNNAFRLMYGIAFFIVYLLSMPLRFAVYGIRELGIPILVKIVRLILTKKAHK